MAEIEAEKQTQNVKKSISPRKREKKKEGEITSDPRKIYLQRLGIPHKYHLVYLSAFEFYRKGFGKYPDRLPEEYNKPDILERAQNIIFIPFDYFFLSDVE